MHIKPGTLCLVVGCPGLPGVWLGRICTFVCYGASDGYRFADSRCDCTVSFADRDALFGFPSRALMPLDGWDAEQELALDVQNELAVMA